MSRASLGIDNGIRLGIVGWKGKDTVRAYVPKNERLHYMRLVGADTSRFETNKFEAKQQQVEEDKKAATVAASDNNGESIQAAVGKETGTA